MIIMKFFIKSYGCASNLADGEFVKTELINFGFEEVDVDKADFIIVNTCAVKGPTINKIKSYISKIKSPKYKIILMGCMPSDKKFINDFKNYSMLSPYNLDEITYLIFYLLKNKKPLHLLKPKKLDKTKFYFNTKENAIVQPLIGC